MSKDAGDLLVDALELPPEARAALAASLLESLEDQVDEGAELGWRTMIQRRAAELDSGAVRRVAWTDLRARLDQHIRS